MPDHSPHLDLLHPASDEARGWLMRWWPEALAAVLLVASILSLRSIPLGHDAVWQMWIARQLAHGAKLYSDVLEVNPPLWFWMAVPLQHLAEATGIPPRDVLRAAMFASLGLSLALIAMLRPGAPRLRVGMYLGLLLAATVVAMPDFAQREHYALLAAAPWVALIAVRAERRPVPFGLAALIAVFAASGFALKIHFAIVPIALEVWLAITLRQIKLWRPEVVVLSVGAVAYAAAVIASEYLRLMIPMVLLAYGEYGRPPFYFVFFQVAVPLSLTLGIGWFAAGGVRTKQGWAALVASLSFLVSYIAQQKGWRYHTLPALGLLVMCAGAETLSLRWAFQRHRPAAVATASVLLVAVAEALHVGPYSNEQLGVMREALAGVPRHEPVMMLSVSAYPFPLIEDLGLIWPSRLMASWYLAAVVHGMQDGNLSPALETLAAGMRRQLLEDLLCRPPRRIMVDSEQFSVPGHASPLGYLDLYRMDPALAKFLDRYRPGPTFGRYTTLDLADQAGLERPRHCRPVF